jgi:hypothetical protein
MIVTAEKVNFVEIEISKKDIEKLLSGYDISKESRYEPKNAVPTVVRMYCSDPNTEEGFENE